MCALQCSKHSKEHTLSPLFWFYVDGACLSAANQNTLFGCALSLADELYPSHAFLLSIVCGCAPRGHKANTWSTRKRTVTRAIMTISLPWHVSTEVPYSIDKFAIFNSRVFDFVCSLDLLLLEKGLFPIYHYVDFLLLYFIVMILIVVLVWWWLLLLLIFTIIPITIMIMTRLCYELLWL